MADIQPVDVIVSHVLQQILSTVSFASQFALLLLPIFLFAANYVLLEKE